MANPVIVKGALDVGAAIIGGIGANKRRKKRQRAIEKERQRLLKLRGEDVIDVNKITAVGDRAIIEQSAKSGRRIDKTLGLDVGQAQGGIAERLAGKRMGLRAGNIRENELLTARRKEDINRRLFDLSLEDDGDATLETIGNVVGIAGSTTANVLARNQARDLAQENIDQKIRLAPKPALPLTSGEGDFQRIAPSTGDFSPPLSDPIIPAFPQNVFQSQADIESQINTPTRIRAASEGAISGGLQPTPKTLQDIALRNVQSGEMTLAEASAALKGKTADTPNFLPGVVEDLSKFQQGFQKQTREFIKDTGALREDPESLTGDRPTTVEDFTKATGIKKPNLRALFDVLHSDEIIRSIGVNAADSIFTRAIQALQAQTQLEFGVGEPPPNDGSFKTHEYQEFVKQWIAAGANKKR